MPQHQPFFSIIIPTYNRPKQLADCLKLLIQSDYSRDRFEVIVVDDGGKMPLQSVVARFHDRCDIILITLPHAGPALARNMGAVRAKGTILVFIDDDCIIAPNWLNTLETRFAEIRDCVIGGYTRNALPDNLYSTASQLLVDYLYKYYNSNRAYFFASNNLALPKDIFHALGGFDKTFPLAAGEDREFCDRLLHNGYRMIYAPEVLVYHSHSLTFYTFWRQQFNYGRGAYYFRKIRVQRQPDVRGKEPFVFYLQLLIYPFSQVRWRQALLLTTLQLISQVAINAGYVWEWIIQTTVKR